MPELGERIRGDILLTMKGRTNDYYVWHQCPECLSKRWILDWKTKLPNFTGLCQICNARKNNNVKEMVGNKHPRWNSGIQMTRGYAYVLQPEHPKANKRGYVKRSHLVLEKALGRPLREGCVVHHINGVKHDDSVGNLLEVLKTQHQTLHAYQRRLRLESIKEVVGWIEKNAGLGVQTIDELKHGYSFVPIRANKWQAQKKEWGIDNGS